MVYPTIKSHVCLFEILYFPKIQTRTLHSWSDSITEKKPKRETKSDKRRWTRLLLLLGHVNIRRSKERNERERERELLGVSKKDIVCFPIFYMYLSSHLFIYHRVCYLAALKYPGIYFVSFVLPEGGCFTSFYSVGPLLSTPFLFFSIYVFFVHPHPGLTI